MFGHTLLRGHDPVNLTILLLCLPTWRVYTTNAMETTYSSNFPMSAMGCWDIADPVGFHGNSDQELARKVYPGEIEVGWYRLSGWWEWS
jgi:hypothetical protein